jgi:hypothetical protein
MADSVLFKSFKIHFLAYVDDIKQSYKTYVYENLTTETLEYWSRKTFSGSGCHWINFKSYIINLETPNKSSENSSSIVGLFVSSYIWWYVNRVGVPKDKTEIKKYMDFLLDKKLITNNQYFVNDKPLFDFFDSRVSLFCFDDVIREVEDQIKPNRKRGESGSQRSVGGVKKIVKRRK